AILQSAVNVFLLSNDNNGEPPEKLAGMVTNGTNCLDADITMVLGKFNRHDITFTIVACIYTYILTTATGTRGAIKQSGANLLSYELITNSPTRIRNKKLNDILSIQEIETTSMETRQLHSSQKEAMKKIAEFSGEDNELDIDEWLFDLNNLFSVMKLKDETRNLERMGKLTGPALRWKYRQFITEQQVITVLPNDVKNSLKQHLIRNERDIKKPEQWLQVAREEEYIQKRLQQKINSSNHEPKNTPFFEHTLPTATIQPTSTNVHPSNQQPFTSRHYYKKEHQQQSTSTNNRTYSKQSNYLTSQHNRKDYPGNKTQQSNPCLICNKNNHTTTKCFYKKNNGCFKCGQSNHQIRDCPQQHFFE
ncbi:unnamed protein product, partial [Rotaria sp. Silwood1]